MPAVIRYSSGNSAANATLKQALAVVADYRCYSCRQPRSFPDLEIDHLIPRTKPTAEADAASAILKPGGFHIDDPENLAVICRPCNGLKSDRDLTAIPIFLVHQQRAIDAANKVRDAVVKTRDNRGLASQLARAASADFSKPEARQTLLEFAPAVVQQIGLLGEGHVEFVTSEVVRGRSHDVDFDVRVNADSRMRVVRDVTRVLVDRAVLDYYVLVGGVVRDELLSNIERSLAKGPSDEYARELSVGSPDLLHLDVTFDRSDVVRSGDWLCYTTEGSVDGWIAAHIVGDYPSHYSGFVESMTDVWVGGTFKASFSLSLLEVDEVEVADLDVDLTGTDLDIDWPSQ